MSDALFEVQKYRGLSDKTQEVVSRLNLDLTLAF